VPVPQLLVNNPFVSNKPLIKKEHESIDEIIPNKKERDQLQRLLDFIKRVRSNNENTLHQGWDIDSRWEERSAHEVPLYEI